MATILVPADLHSPCHVSVKCQEDDLPGLNCSAAPSNPEALPSFLRPWHHAAVACIVAELAICNQVLRTMYAVNVTEVLLCMQVGCFCSGCSSSS